MTRNEFVNYIVKLVKDYRKTATKEPDFFDSITIAQAIHETGYGTSELYTDYNNAFGYKAKVVNGVPEWDGKVAENYKSDEEIDGVVHKKVESDFRWYDSVEESVADHANMMTRLNGRYLSTYRKALDAKTPKEQARALTGSYAGDSRYAKKLIEVMDEWNLYQYDTEKEETTMPKVLLIAGHGLNKNNGYYDTGAVGYVGKGEHAYFRDDIFPAMKKFLPKGADVVFHTQYNVYSHNNLVSLARSYGSDTIVVECHFDAGGTAYSKAGGHVIIHSSFQPDALDLRIRDAIKKTAGLHPHYKDGISKRNNLRNVTSAANGGINYRLIELGMSTHRENGLYLKNNVDTLAKALVEAIWGTSDNTTKPVESTQSSNNPQGLETTKIPTYTAPKLPFDRLEKGAKVTFRDPWNWYDDATKEFIHSKKHDELKGTQFTIEEVKEIDAIGYSKVAYKSAEHNSWILEQDIIEARDSWEVVEVEPDEKQDVEELQEGQFWLDDKLYQVTEIKK